MATTIASSTNAVEGLLHLASSTPSESSVYLDIDDEVEVSPNTSSEISPSSTSAAQESTSLITQGDLSQITAECPQTPTRSALSLHVPFDSLEISPSSSSERSTSSRSSSIIDHRVYSPITERSRSSSFASFNRAKPRRSRKLFISGDPCLQCFLAGLSCSFSEDPSKSKSKPSTTCCRRCVRNKECFCIIQVATEKIETDIERYWRRKRQGSASDYDFTYYSHDIEEGVVMERVEELLELRKASRRFELPKMMAWKRQLLRPVWSGWVENNEEAVEVVGLGP